MKQLSIYDNEFIGDFDNTHQANRAIKQTTNYLKLNISPNETDSNRTQVYDDKPVYVEQNEFPANVTEIVLTKDKMDSIQLILPMLINLHQKERWLAWIDPPIQLLKEWQKTHNDSALNDIMILRSNDNLSVFELSKRALTAGTCHAVIAWTNNLNQDEFSKLEAASSKGNSHGIILKSRIQPS
tara:strand:+ start:6066 stop:6617 length:552 start_codon:yes stop_codon:yes gene_type:complete